MCYGVPFSLWDCLFAEGSEIAVRCAMSHAAVLPPNPPLHASVDVQPSPWASLWLGAPLPSSFVQGEPQSPLA